MQPSICSELVAPLATASRAPVLARHARSHWHPRRRLGLACTRGTSHPATEVALAANGDPVHEAPDSSSARRLALLPDGETTRRFILDCTGCHQFDATIARVHGRPRTREEWEAAIRRPRRRGSRSISPASRCWSARAPRARRAMSS